jgi:hypothetical protein
MALQFRRYEGGQILPAEAERQLSTAVVVQGLRREWTVAQAAPRTVKLAPRARQEPSAPTKSVFN